MIPLDWSFCEVSWDWNCARAWTERSRASWECVEELGERVERRVRRRVTPIDWNEQSECVSDSTPNKRLVKATHLGSDSRLILPIHLPHLIPLKVNLLLNLWQQSRQFHPNLLCSPPKLFPVHNLTILLHSRILEYLFPNPRRRGAEAELDV
jgi:hypothetical protein